MLKLRWVKLERICSRIDRQYCGGGRGNVSMFESVERDKFLESNSYLKRFQVSHVEDKNVDLHAPQTQRVVVEIPFGEIVNWELFLLAIF